MMRRPSKAAAAAAAVECQARCWSGVGNPNAFQPVQDTTNRKQVLGLYKDCLESMRLVKASYGLPTPIPVMKKRIRLAFELNRNVKDPFTIKTMVSESRVDLHNAIAQIYTSPHYLLNKYFRTSGETLLSAAAVQYENREMLMGRQRSLMKARAIAHGMEDFPELPGRVVDEDGEVRGYYHPKGDLPPGESPLFARPPEYKDWGEFSLPDPWNPENSPDGPPDPHLAKNQELQYRVAMARVGPYTRHRTRRLIEHEKKTREMSEAEYLEYFRKNEVHYAANEFELPEYAWAEDRMERRLRRASVENQEIFAEPRASWVSEYKGHWKAVNYAPAMDYWVAVFRRWLPNYSSAVVEAAVDGAAGSTFRRFLSESPARYAAYRSPAFRMREAAATSFREFVMKATRGDPSSGRRPYDHPAFVDKWFTDNGVEHLLILQEDAGEGLGIPHGDLTVLVAEAARLKDEIGCAELSEQRYKGEWWNRGHIKLLDALVKINDMELCSAILEHAKVSPTATYEEAAAAISAVDWSSFDFNGYERTYLRYPDGDQRGVHAWRVGEDEAEAEANLHDKWESCFRTLFNYEQTVPIWLSGCSRRYTMNKGVDEGGWSFKEDKKPFYDQLVSY